MNLKMVLDKKNIKEIKELPRKYRVLPLVVEDIDKWIDAEVKSGKKIDKENAYKEELINHCINPKLDIRMVLKTEFEEVVATATIKDNALVWIGIIPTFRNKKLSYPFLATILNQAKKDPIITSILSSNVRAFLIYTKIGFKPFIQTKEEQDAWHQLNENIGKKLIHQYNINPLEQSFQLE